MTPDAIEEAAAHLTTPRIFDLMKFLVAELLRRDANETQHIYLVDGVYEDECQITGDIITAVSRDEAVDLVTAVRGAELVGDNWDAAGVTPALEDLAAALEVVSKSPAEIEDGLARTLRDLGGGWCRKCGQVFAIEELDDSNLCGDCQPSNPNADLEAEELADKRSGKEL